MHDFPRQMNTSLVVVHEHRDLGGHLGFTMRRTGTTFNERIKEATRQCELIPNIPGPFRNRHRVIVGEYIPRAVYGASTAPENWSVLNKLSSAIADIYLGKSNGSTRNTRSIVLTFYACGTDNTSIADPWHCIFHKRLFDPRRAWVKRPHLQHNINDIIQHYHTHNQPGRSETTMILPSPCHEVRTSKGGMEMDA